MDGKRHGRGLFRNVFRAAGSRKQDNLRNGHRSDLAGRKFIVHRRDAPPRYRTPTCRSVRFFRLFESAHYGCFWIGSPVICEDSSRVVPKSPIFLSCEPHLGRLSSWLSAFLRSDRRDYSPVRKSEGRDRPLFRSSTCRSARHSLT